MEVFFSEISCVVYIEYVMISCYYEKNMCIRKLWMIILGEKHINIMGLCMYNRVKQNVIFVSYVYIYIFNIYIYIYIFAFIFIYGIIACITCMCFC